MQKIRVGGVPEHFNFPWIDSIKNQLFSENNIEISWTNCPSGTGQMLSMLEIEELDLAITLTEGTVSKCQTDDSIYIIQKYVDSPLCWGVHTGINNKTNIRTDPHFLISRHGSGSHLMALLLADKLGIDRDKVSFEIIGTLNNALEYYKTNDRGYFLWEKYTTSPFVNQLLLKRIDEINTPWPCFVICCKFKFYLKNITLVQNVIHLVLHHCEILKSDPKSVEKISDYYNIDKNIVEEWFQKLIWSQLGDRLSIDEIEKVKESIKI